MVIVIMRILHVIIITKSDVWSICHCLRLGHGTMICAVCFFCILISSMVRLPFVGNTIFKVLSVLAVAYTSIIGHSLTTEKEIRNNTWPSSSIAGFFGGFRFRFFVIMSPVAPWFNSGLVTSRHFSPTGGSRTGRDQLNHHRGLGMDK